VGTLAKDGKTVLARPVDCVEAPDGTVLFSSDSSKQIYRIGKAE
jgi:glucose/arabinose dehydrogenase